MVRPEPSRRGQEIEKVVSSSLFYGLTTRLLETFLSIPNLKACRRAKPAIPLNLPARLRTQPSCGHQESPALPETAPPVFGGASLTFLVVTIIRSNALRFDASFLGWLWVGSALKRRSKGAENKQDRDPELLFWGNTTLPAKSFAKMEIILPQLPNRDLLTGILFRARRPLPGQPSNHAQGN